jgi:hypothetical protein
MNPAHEDLRLLAESRNAIVIRADRKRAARFAVLSLLSVVTSVFMLRDGTMGSFGYYVAAFAAMSAVYWATAFLPNTYMELSPEGFTFQGGLRRFAYRWNDVEEFLVSGTGRGGSVCFNVSTLSLRHNSTLQRLHRDRTGFDDWVPKVFKLPPQDLADALNDWRSRFGDCGSDGPMPLS